MQWYKNHDAVTNSWEFDTGLALKCLKMGRNMFAFSNVLNVENDFFKKFEERIHPFDVQYWACDVEQTYEHMNDDPGKRNVKGMVKFGMKQELPDVKQWFLSVFGNILCAHLFVKEHEKELILCEHEVMESSENKTKWKKKTRR